MPWKSNSATARRTSASSSARRCSTQRSSSGIASAPTASAGGEPVERAQQIAQRVAQPAIDIALMLQDLGADAQILGIIGADHPQAQDVGAALLA